MTDVTVVCDRDPVAAGDDAMSNGWSATVPASMPLSQVVREHVVPHLASVRGLVEWVVTLAPDLVFRVASEAEGLYPTTYHLKGDRCRAGRTPLAVILREPDESTGLQKLVAMEVPGPDVPVGQLQPNSEGDVAFYVIYHSPPRGR